MGRTQSITDKIEKDDEFRKFMDKLEEESQKEEDRILEKLTGIAKKQYEGNGWDYSRFFGNKQSDYQNYDDWSLNRINNIINSIGTALQGGNYPSDKVPGSKDASPSTIDKAKEFMGAFGGDYSLIIARVQALISGVLSQFTVASQVGRRTTVQDTPLSGGLHLFFGSTGSVYTNNTFFTNQYIGSFQIVFEVYMSVAEAQSIALQQILVTTSKELETLNELIILIVTEMKKSLTEIIKNSIEDYKSTKAAYDLALDDTKVSRDKLMEEYNKYNDVIETIENLMPQLDLSDFGIKVTNQNSIKLDLLFNDWELGIAKRYLNEKLADKNILELSKS